MLVGTETMVSTIELVEEAAEGSLLDGGVEATDELTETVLPVGGDVLSAEGIGDGEADKADGEVKDTEELSGGVEDMDAKVEDAGVLLVEGGIGEYVYRSSLELPPQNSRALPAHSMLHDPKDWTVEPPESIFPQKHSLPYSTPINCAFLPAQNIEHIAVVMLSSARNACVSARPAVASE